MFCSRWHRIQSSIIEDAVQDVVDKIAIPAVGQAFFEEWEVADHEIEPRGTFRNAHRHLIKDVIVFAGRAFTRAATERGLMSRRETRGQMDGIGIEETCVIHGALWLSV